MYGKDTCRTANHPTKAPSTRKVTSNIEMMWPSCFWQSFSLHFFVTANRNCDGVDVEDVPFRTCQCTDGKATRFGGDCFRGCVSLGHCFRPSGGSLAPSAVSSAIILGSHRFICSVQACARLARFTASVPQAFTENSTRMCQNKGFLSTRCRDLTQGHQTHLG